MDDNDKLCNLFLASAEKVKLLKKEPDDDEKLFLYGYYKQALLGDCDNNKPSLLNYVQRKKYESWKILEGMEKEKAMKHYIFDVKQLIKKYGIEE